MHSIEIRLECSCFKCGANLYTTVNVLGTSGLYDISVIPCAVCAKEEYQKGYEAGLTEKERRKKECFSK